MTGIGFGPQSAAVVFDNRSADRQTDSHASTLGGVEGVEEPRCVLMCDADSGILHAQPHTVAFMQPGPNGQAPGAIIDTAHCLCSVHYKIEDDLLKLHTITDNWGQALA